MTDPEMEAAYRRDYETQARMDELRAHIAAFTDTPPRCVRASTLGVLVQAVRVLGEESDRIVRRWD